VNVNLLIGLGNPGRKYSKTRHNIGFVVLDNLADKFGFDLKKKKFKSYYSIQELFGKKVCLVKPLSYMNLSGEFVDAFWNYYKVEGRDVLIVHDDIDLPFGKIRLSYASGHGGHNGIRSIVDWVGNNEFYRLRIGVGRPTNAMDPADYVLQAFDKVERKELEEIVSRAISAIQVFYEEGPSSAMQQFNS